jgi:sialate O-acetylesterase
MGDTSVFSWTDMLFLTQNEKLASYLSNYRTEVAKYPKPETYHERFHKQLPILLEFYNRINKNVAAGMSSEEAHKKAYEIGDPTLPMGPKHYNRPSGMYDTLVRTIIPYSTKGVLFYQGSSDLQNGDLYGEAFKTMVKSWRHAFNDNTLPFCFVQLAGYSYPGAPEAGIMPVRDGQASSIDVKNGLFMTSAIDLGEENNIHPKDKTVIAKRLFGVVMERIYSRGKNQMSPAAFSVQGSGKKIIICTQYNDLNLYSKSGRVFGFELSYDGTTFETTDKVKLQINQILIECDRPAVMVRYAYKNFPHCDIYTSNELPLLPFSLPIVWPKP